MYTAYNVQLSDLYDFILTWAFVTDSEDDIL